MTKKNMRVRQGAPENAVADEPEKTLKVVESPPFTAEVFGLDEFELDLDEIDEGAPIASLVPHMCAAASIPATPTGLPSLDAALRGGLRPLDRTVLCGAPEAGKTALAVFIAHALERQGWLIGWLGTDEGAPEIVLRFAQVAGCDREKLSVGDAAERERAGQVLRDRRIRFFKCSTHEAMLSLASWAHRLNKPALLVLDSLQKVRPYAETGNVRDVVEANCEALRSNEVLRLATLATSEVARDYYRPGGKLDVAAGKESGSVEYTHQKVVTVGLVKGCDDARHVTLAKNRAGNGHAEFFVRFDRGSHTFEEVADPVGEAKAERSTKKAQEIRTRILRWFEENGEALTRGEIVSGVRASKKLVLAAINECIADGTLTETPVEGTRSKRLTLSSANGSGTDTLDLFQPKAPVTANGSKVTQDSSKAKTAARAPQVPGSHRFHNGGNH